MDELRDQVSAQQLALMLLVEVLSARDGGFAAVYRAALDKARAGLAPNRPAAAGILRMVAYAARE